MKWVGEWITIQSAFLPKAENIKRIHRQEDHKLYRKGDYKQKKHEDMNATAVKATTAS